MRARKNRPPRLAQLVVRLVVGAIWGESVIADMDDAFARDVNLRGSWWAYRRYWREAMSVGTWRLRHELNKPLGSGRDPVGFDQFAQHIISAERSTMVQTLIQDIRFAIRTLVRTPIITGIAILTLALGIGANSAIFSVINGVILKPLEYPEPTELVFVTSAFHGLGFDQFWMSAPEFWELQEWSDSYLELGAYNTGDISIAGTDTPIRVSGAFATAELFAALGVAPAMGRLISPVDDAPQAAPVFMISHELWQRAFGSDPAIIGKTFEVGGTTRTVIGVMPPRFDIHAEGVEAWVPLQLDPANPPGRSSHFLYAVGRLKPGVSPELARAEMTTLLTRWEEAGLGHSPNTTGHPLNLEQLQEEVIGDVRPALLVLLGAVGFVLLIACANVGNLLLARAEARQKEIAVRTALGAGRGRLAKQFLTESVVLSVVGGAIGLILGWFGVTVLLSNFPDSIPRANEVALDGSVLIFTIGVSILAGLVFGLAPLLHLAVKDLSASLQDGGQRTTASSARLILRRGLVASELALAVILVIGAGLMLRSFSALQQVDPGFQVDNLLSFNISTTFTSGAEEAAFLEDLRNQLSGLPGVDAVANMSGLPPNRRLNANTMEFEGLQQTPDGPPHNVDFWQFVSDDYFNTMRIPILEGRSFVRQDVDGSLPVVMINEQMARTFWPDESPIGRRLRSPGSPNWLTIIGVVKDVKQQGMDRETGTELYYYNPQVVSLFNFAFGTMNFVVRTTVPPLSLARSVRETVWSLDPTLPVADVSPMDRVIFESVARPRFLTLLLLTFGAVALTLAALGTYGVMSYTVAERTQEMGIRVALGAQSGAVIRLILRQGLIVAGVGLAIGTAGAVAVTKLMRSILFGVSATDVATFAAVPLILLVVATAACLVPAIRATRVDPVTVLKAQ